MKRRGSALIFVLIIIAGIVTVTIGTQRLSLVQFNQATREEDNTFALYAAKAGIEDGLLRFRHERDVETEKDKVHRFNVSGGDNYNEVDKNRLVSDEVGYSADDQYYDLAINFRANKVGTFDFSQPYNVKKDQEIELTGFPRDNDPYYLVYSFRWAANCRDIGGDPTKDAFVQLQKSTDQPTDPSLFEQRVVTIPVSGDPAIYRSYGGNSTNWLVGSASSIRLRAYYCPVDIYISTARDNNDRDGGPEFDSLTTKITATGYFGTAKRTLEATLDRKSGRLISIYDFNLYSGQTCISADPAFLNTTECN